MDQKSITALFFAILGIVLAAIYIIAFWKVFKKAGQPGWAALVPLYNYYLLIKMAGRPGWWILLLFIPVLNIVIIGLIAVGIAKAFGKGTLFGILGLWFFSFIGYSILAFGNSTYKSPVTPAPSPAPVQT